MKQIRPRSASPTGWALLGYNFVVHRLHTAEGMLALLSSFRSKITSANYERNYNLMYLVFLLLAAFFHFNRLSWGTPSWDKHLQIFETKEELQRFIQPMIQLREQYWSSYMKMLDPKLTEEQSREIYRKTFQSQQLVPSFSELPREMVLERIRGYLIGVVVSDEQYRMKAISNLNPKKLDFNPDIYAADGGFFYYTCGAVLMAGKLLGWISLTPGVEYYFNHPEETSRMYTLLRAISGISLLLTMLLYFSWIRSFTDEKSAMFSLAFLVSAPIFVLMSHMVKAHIYGMFLFSAGFYFYWKSISDPRWRNVLFGVLFMGLAAGSIITNLALVSVIAIIEWARTDWNLLKTLRSGRMWLSILLFFLLYSLTNFYILLDPKGFEKTLWGLKEYTKGYDEYAAISVHTWVPFFKDLFTRQLHWTVLPVILAGFVHAFRTKDKFLLTCVISIVFLTLMNLLSTRHPGVSLRTFPLVSILFAVGCRCFLDRSSTGGKIFFSAYLFLSLGLSAAQSYFNLRVFQEPTTLTQAGKWINENIPKSESIGVVGGQFSQAGFPPIQFLHYKLIHFPKASEEVRVPKKILPNYVVTTDDNHPLLKEQYKAIKIWEKREKIAGFHVRSQWVVNGNENVYVFKKG